MTTSVQRLPLQQQAVATHETLVSVFYRSLDVNINRVVLPPSIPKEEKKSGKVFGSSADDSRSTGDTPTAPMKGLPDANNTATPN